MAGFVDTISTSFKQTLNWTMWLYFLLVFLIEGIVLGIVALILVFVGFFTLLVPITAAGGIENIAALIANTSFIAGSIGTVIILFLIFTIIATFIGSLFTGIRYHLFNDFLKTGKFDIGKSFKKAKPRVFTFFIISLIIGLIVLAVFAVAFAPILFLIPGLITGTVAGSNAAAILAPMLFGVLLVFLAALVIFLIFPMLNLLAPAVFFEERGAIATIKRAFGLMTANYFGNLAYIILFILIILATRMLLEVLFLPITLMLGIMESGGAAVAGLLIIVGIIFSIIMLIYMVWSTVFDVASFRNLYFLDKGLLAGPASKHHAKSKRRAKKKKPKK